MGAILILSKPENRDKIPLFVGIERVRYRRPVYPGDVVEIEARVKRLRSRMGQLYGFARVNGTRRPRWDDDLCARAGVDAAAPKETRRLARQRRRLLFQLDAVATALLRSIERRIRA